MYQEVGELAKLVLKEKGTGIIFCSYEQFPKWVQTLKDLDLHVQQIPLVFVPPREDGTFRLKRSNYLVNITQIAVVFHKSFQYFRQLQVLFHFLFFFFRELVVVLVGRNLDFL